MSERPQLAPALGLVRDRISGPPPRRQTAAPAPVAAPAGNAEPEKPNEERGAVEAKPKKAARPKASSASTGGMKRTTISIPQRLAASMRERLQADRKVSQIQFILNAIEANAHQLAELVEKERPAAPTTRGLFPDQSTSRNVIEERTTINFDTTEANLKVIDSLVEKHGADSRSQLIRAALRAVLAD
ncbi:MAG: CopG family ribbon-helix-helix protein [Nocardioides sp.]